jgi:hypothetical protein
MIVYHKSGEIDRTQWDNCIRNSAGSKPYAFSWCLDIMAPGWEALVDDEYDSVFPIPSLVRFGIKYTSTPRFLQQLGAFSPDKPVAQAVQEFLDFMPEIYRITDLNIAQKVDHHSFKVTEKFNYELNLSASYDELEKKFTPECRRFISQAAKKYEPTDDITPRELIKICQADRIFGFKTAKPSDYERIETLMNYCLSTGKGRITGVRTARKKVIYGIFLLQVHGSITILLEANTAGSLQKHIGYHIINEVIRQSASKHLLLDFAGTDGHYQVPAGKSFGGWVVPYYRIYRNRLLWPARIMK